MRRTRQAGTRPVRLVELFAVVERLARAVEPEYVSVWLHTQLAALDDQRPIDALARGEFHRVIRVIAALESPVAS